jgi:hypothetical protein
LRYYYGEGSDNRELGIWSSNYLLLLCHVYIVLGKCLWSLERSHNSKCRVFMTPKRINGKGTQVLTAVIGYPEQRKNN